MLCEPELDARVLRGLEALARLGSRLVAVDRAWSWTSLSCECAEQDVVAAVQYISDLSAWLRTRSRACWLGAPELRWRV